MVPAVARDHQAPASRPYPPLCDREGGLAVTDDRESARENRIWRSRVTANRAGQSAWLFGPIIPVTDTGS